MFDKFFRAIGVMPHTFDSIVADFDLAISRLNAHSDAKYKEAVLHQNTITQFVKARDAAHDEGAKAAKVADKLAGIISA